MLRHVEISGSVGRRGRNIASDVKSIQERLNAGMGPRRTALIVDGKAGRKTIAMIKDFQDNACNFNWPDGRVDVDGRTIRTMNSLSALSHWKGKPETHRFHEPKVAGQLSRDETEPRGLRLIADEAAWARDDKAFEEFREFLVDKSTPKVKIFVSSISNAAEARKIFSAWQRLRLYKYNPRESAQIMSALVGLKSRPAVLNAIDALATPSSRFGRAVSRSADAAGKVSKVLMAIQIADKFLDGDYLYGAAEAYKYWMGKLIPIAGIVEGAQGLLDAVIPGSIRKHSTIFKLIRSIDPLGHGGNAIDTGTTLVLSGIYLYQTGRIDIVRLSRLSDRLKDGTGAIFADMGEDLGSSLYEMGRWRSEDWRYAKGKLAQLLLKAI